MAKKTCTSGVYIHFGTNGTRVGQSECMESRSPQSMKDNADCLGEVKKVVFIPQPNPKAREALEKNLIDQLKSTNSCNKIRA